MAEQTAAIAYNLNLNSDAEVEDRIAGLKILAAFSPKPLDRQRCLTEILTLRSLQLRATMRKPYSAESKAPMDGVPASPSREQAAVLSSVAP